MPLLLAVFACKPVPAPEAEEASDAGSEPADGTAGHSTDGHGDGGTPPDDSATAPGNPTATSGLPPDAPTTTAVTTEDSASEETTSPSNGCESGGIGMHQPNGPLVPLESSDPSAIDSSSGEFDGIFQILALRDTDTPSWSLWGEAAFFHIDHPRVDVICGVELDLLDGPDDCSLRYYGGFGWGGDDYDALSAGTATLHGLGFSEPMPMTEPPNERYTAALSDLGHTPQWGEPYGITWTGDRLPAGDLPELVHLPDELEIVTPPNLDWLFIDADFELAWTGAGNPPLTLRATFTPDLMGGTEWYELTCAMSDDGAFIIPGAIIALIPPGWTGNGYVRRRVQSPASAGDLQILGDASVSLEVRIAVAG